MTFELTLLAWSVVLLFVHIGAQSTMLTRDLGSDYNASPRDEQRPLGVGAGRAARALHNFLETYPAFIALALIVGVTGETDWLTQWGAALYLLFRVAYLPLYILGIKYVRSIAFMLASIGLVMMLVGIAF